MEFIIDENGCRQLSIDMSDLLKEICTIIAEIENHNGVLKVALGDDYDAIAKSIRIITNELNYAEKELNIIISDMKEYMAQVHQARVSLQ